MAWIRTGTDPLLCAFHKKAGRESVLLFYGENPFGRALLREREERSMMNPKGDST